MKPSNNSGATELWPGAGQRCHGHREAHLIHFMGPVLAFSLIQKIWTIENTWKNNRKEPWELSNPTSESQILADINIPSFLTAARLFCSTYTPPWRWEYTTFWVACSILGLLCWLERPFWSNCSNEKGQKWFSLCQLKHACRTALVVQWLTISLPMQGTWVWSLVWEDPTCCRATKPNALQLLGQSPLKPMLHNKRRHCDEKPTHHSKE